MDPLEQLRIADPDTYTWVKGRIGLMASRPNDALLALLAQETVWALSQEEGLGRSMAQGLLQLLSHAQGRNAPLYAQRVRQAAQVGPTLARLLAVHLVAVLKTDHLLDPLTATVAIMRTKGTYTLSEPLEVLTELLNGNDPLSALAYLELLNATFGQEITYNHCVRLVYLIPHTVRGFASKRRKAQIDALHRVVQTDLKLVDTFVEGLPKGLALLGPVELERFLDQALAHHRQAPSIGMAFMGLSSQLGQAACAGLQTTVPLAHLKSRLVRYLNARLDQPISLKPMAAARMETQAAADIRSDGRSIYLPEEIDHYSTHAQNRFAAETWVRWEAGYFENHTFAFDLERAADLYPLVAQQIARRPEVLSSKVGCDAERFFDLFAQPALAEDLFAIFEQARVALCMAHDYPGLVQQTLPLMRQEVARMQRNAQWHHPLAPLYDNLVLDLSLNDGADPTAARWCLEPSQLFHAHITHQSPVEACADLVCRCFTSLCQHFDLRGGPYICLIPPFGRRLCWSLVRTAFAQQAELALRIKVTLDAQGLSVYRSDVQSKLDAQQGLLSTEDIRTLVLMRGVQRGPMAMARVDWSQVDLTALFQAAGMMRPEEQAADGPAFYYPEWDVQLQDYLHAHVRVQETLVKADGDGDFYRQTLDLHRGLVARIRRAFEFLKPEGLVMLRRWPDGDAFDHQALIDFAVDLRAGRIPSDRLFIKRLKQERDVAALLLVDLSRSTANPVVGGQETVIDVAKQALVLFCEALQVVGDTFAMAGFSGTGRHSVDYFRIKNFNEPLSPMVQGRIKALHPQRSTRMGAAIRHATAQLATMAARVRLLIVVSDGFPNDLGYKAEYAIADTRRAVQEARSRNVHVKAITVNIGSDPRLDDLYGRPHHHVIADVRELPDKLLRLYGTLTKRL